jgi:hypothetical protein
MVLHKSQSVSQGEGHTASRMHDHCIHLSVGNSQCYFVNSASASFLAFFFPSWPSWPSCLFISLFLSYSAFFFLLFLLYNYPLSQLLAPSISTLNSKQEKNRCSLELARCKKKKQDTPSPSSNYSQRQMATYHHILIFSRTQLVSSCKEKNILQVPK